MERISKTDHEYAGVKLTAGDRFNVEPQDVRLLLVLGRIEPEEGEPGYQPESAHREQVNEPTRRERARRRNAAP